ncbi:MAG: twin-arginine translocase TatA/TatE family subunit [Phycisphaerae bacterium]
MLAFLGLPGGGEWIIVLIIALLVFGPRLPAVMRSIGKGVVEFKKGLRDVEDDVDKAVEEQPKKELKG